MSEEPTDQSAPSAPVADAIEELEVRIDLDFGHLSLPVAELNGLAEGQVFDLGTPPERVVQVSVAGRRIGTGELVDLGGSLGVRITRLFGSERS